MGKTLDAIEKRAYELGYAEGQADTLLRLTRTAKWVEPGHCDCCYPERCDKAPPGWRCSRSQEHDGPCAARPVEVRDDLITGVVTDA